MVNVRTLAAFLKARGWSRAELARRIGVSRQAVSLWFRGDEAHAQLRATLLWDRAYPDLDDFAVALHARDPRALGRFVEVYGLFAAEVTLGSFVWGEFPNYKRHIHPVRRRELETLWAWHESRKAA